MPTSAGRRSLRNVALDLLAATAAPQAIARAAKQYDAADNMTDRMAALATLVAARRAGTRARARRFLRALRRRCAGDRQMVLAAGHDPAAGHARPSARAHRAPRLLVRQSQPRARADRRLRARQTPPSSTAPTAPATISSPTHVLALDPKNPQLAARLATAFRTWRTLEAGRRAKARSRSAAHQGRAQPVARSCPISSNARSLLHEMQR